MRKNIGAFTPLESPVPLQMDLVTEPAAYGENETRKGRVSYRKGPLKTSSFLTGFTLAEVMISIVLVTVIVLAFFGAFSSSFNYLRRVIELRNATLVLQEEMSVIRELKFSEIQNLPATFSSNSMSSLHNSLGSIIRSSYSGQSNILKITLRLRWSAFDGATVNKTMVTLITNNGIDKK
jgi:type II secretory pathway pseudopilin PulG